ncbi:MAG: amidase family protein, partial [Bacteroidota bacterium]
MFSFHSIQQYQNSLLNGTATCVEAVEFFLHRIQNTRHLNAFTQVFAEEALQKAAVLDADRLAGKPVGKLHGVVVAIKDVICYKGHTVTAASHILQGFTATYNATAVQKLLNAQAIIIGVCNCDEFAMGSSN